MLTAGINCSKDQLLVFGVVSLMPASSFNPSKKRGSLLHYRSIATWHSELKAFNCWTASLQFANLILALISVLWQ